MFAELGLADAINWFEQALISGSDIQGVSITEHTSVETKTAKMSYESMT